jgi:hypothetical protein
LGPVDSLEQHYVSRTQDLTTFMQTRWLLSHGRDDEALEVLSCIEAMAPDDPYIKT